MLKLWWLIRMHEVYMRDAVKRLRQVHEYSSYHFLIVQRCFPMFNESHWHMIRNVRFFLSLNV